MFNYFYPLLFKCKLLLERSKYTIIMINAPFKLVVNELQRVGLNGIENNIKTTR